MVLLGPNAETAWVSNAGSGEVAVINLTSGEVENIIPVGKDPQGGVMTRDGKRIYVTNHAGNTAGNTISIAEKLGINRKTLERWRKIAEFRARVKSITEAAQKKALEHAIANKYRRLSFLNELWLGLRQVIDARAIDPAMQRAPGGKTGLLVRRLRSIRVPKGFEDVALVDRNTLTRGSKTTFRVIEEFKVDAALLRSARRLEELAAREMGQWGNDHEHTTVGLQNEPFQSTVADAARKLTPEQ
jgi:hypothetical protein